MDGTTLVGGIELGGTKTIVAVGKPDGTVIESTRFATCEPQNLVPQIAGYFADRRSSHGQIAALGVGAFGPIVVDPKSPDYGRLLGTNKPGWSGFDLAKELTKALSVPLHLVTDVAAAGMGEARRGNLLGIDLGLYLTIGTGIGGALIHEGQPLPSLLHPEMGHLPLVRQAGDLAQSTCQFHPNCAEGLAAGPAIMARFGAPLNAFQTSGPEQTLVADYIGQLLASLQLACSPQRIVLGGGVSQAAGLLDQARHAMRRHLGEYIDCKLDEPGFLVPPALEGEAGIVGALVAAASELQSGTGQERRRA